MRKILHILLLAALATAVSSCVSDEFGLSDGSPSKATQANVLLHLETSGDFASKITRSLTLADENKLTDVYVLVFDKDNRLVGIQKGKEVSSEPSSDPALYSGGGDFSISLPVSTGVEAKSSSKLVVLANAEAILDACNLIDKDDPDAPGTQINQNYDTVIGLIYDTISGAMFTGSNTAIPMWGETGQIAIDPSTAPRITLMRAVARVDVGLGNNWDGYDAANARIPFRLQTVNVVRANTDYRLVPNTSTLITEDSKPSVDAPTLYSSNKFDATETQAAKFAYNAYGGLYSTQSIYVPEADILMGGTKSGDANHRQRMAVVIGGVYDANKNQDYTDDGAPTYYRLDFAHGTALIDVLRNHLYRFNIQSVSEEGYPSVIEAYEANDTKMTADIAVWNNGGSGDHQFEGQYSLTIEQPRMLIAGLAGESVTFDITTDYPKGWMVTGDHFMAPNGNGEWLKYSIKSGPAGTTSLTLTAINANINLGDRRAYIRLGAGNMDKEIIVTQAPHGIRNLAGTDPGVIGYIWNPGQPNHNTLTKKKDDGDDSNGIIYIAYFKHRSLVAMGGVNYSTFTTSDIVAWPQEWAPSVHFGKDRAAMDAKFTGVAPGIDTYNVITTVPTPTTPSDSSKAWGDPCTYYFKDGQVTPEAGDYASFATDPGFNISTLSSAETLWWNTLDIAHFPDNSSSLIAAGYRSALYGSFFSRGVEAEYWSIDASNSNTASYLRATSSIANQGVWAGPINMGLPVRCANPKRKVVANAGTGGTAKVTNDAAGTRVTPKVEKGHEATFTATPNAPSYISYEFDGWTGTGIALTEAQRMTNPLTITMPDNDVTLTASFISTVRSTGTAPGVIGYIWNPGKSNHLTLTMDKDDGNDANGIVYVAFFKYGSLVALTSQNRGEFSVKDIAAWPTNWAANRAAMEAKFSGAATAQAAYEVIPYVSSIPATPTPEDALGDPCVYHFNGAYRMPTLTESQTFTGGATGSVSGLTFGYTAATLSRPPLGTFLTGATDIAGNPYSLPFTGNRVTDGSVVGTSGFYWTISTRNFLSFSSQSFSHPYTTGNIAKAIRCHKVS